MANTILVDIMDKNDFNAGSKARNDVNVILQKRGFQPVVIYNRKHGKIGKAFDLLKAYPRLGSTLEDGSLVVVQYPYGLSVMRRMLARLRKIKERKRIQIVILIHDVGFLRDICVSKRDLRGGNLMEQEIAIFNQADIVISHSVQMSEILRQKGVRTRLLNLGPFDYLYDGPLAKNAVSGDSFQVVYAGNLAREKSGFLYSCPKFENVDFHLYGLNSKELPAHFHYKGAFPAEELIENMEGNYGLVWDGESASTCAGVAGEYLRYNSPHKCSLYIAAGLPILIWKKAAAAEYVEKHKIGLCVDSLYELESLLVSISEQEYLKMRQNVLSVRENLVTGGQLGTIIQGLQKECKEKEF